MAIARTFHSVNQNDVTLTPFKVYKRFTISNENITDSSSGYLIWNAIHSNVPVPIGSNKANNELTNSFDGSYQHNIWKQIDLQYYRYPYDSTRTLEHSNNRFTYKFLNVSASILSIPYLDCGESIKAGSVEFTQSAYKLSDDQNGNLYDVNIDTCSFAPRENLVAYWGFNDEFRRFNYRTGTITNGRLTYKSNVFQVDRDSYVRNANIVDGVKINNIETGQGIEVDNSLIYTNHHDEFNFDKDFTISFWIRSYDGDDLIQTIISKNTLIEKQEFGKLSKPQNDLIVKSLHVSQSFVYDPINVYPFKFYYDRDNGQMLFSRSNGINTLTLSSSYSSGLDWIHFAAVKSGSNFTLYKDSVVQQSGSFNSDNCFNKHAICFASDDLGRNRFQGILDEIRFYNIGLTESQIQTLAKNTDQSLYQTAVCGNVFYRRGNVVISGFDNKYKNSFSENYTLKYRGTHTIYQREMLIRIPKGSFNLTHNPTALQSYKSDLLINDFVSGSLFPYVTEIGFYDDEGNLLAVAKLNQPLKMRDDVDINIITRFDV